MEKGERVEDNIRDVISICYEKAALTKRNKRALSDRKVLDLTKDFCAGSWV